MENFNFILRPRLMAAAQFVRHGTVAADIGTDHGYLAAYIAGNGICQKVIASDLRQGPLENARSTVEELNLEDKISLILSDGLKALPENSAEDIIIAGMGGTLISDILRDCGWIKQSGIRLILQPMSHGSDVRKFLWQNGFEILSETAVEDCGRVYCVICAEFSGNIYNYSPGEEYCGKLPECGNEAAERILTASYLHIKTRAQALKKAERGEDELKYLDEAEKYIQSVIKSL